MKNTLLIAMSLIIVGCAGVGCADAVYVAEKADSTRMQVQGENILSGYMLTVVLDTKTGREYLVYGNGGLVEIKPKGE